MIARSQKMYAIKNDVGDYLAVNCKTWTSDFRKARWYAYRAYACEMQQKIKIGKVVYRERDENICKAGGQKHKCNR